MPTPTFTVYVPGMNDDANAKIKGLTNSYIDMSQYMQWILSHLDEKNVIRAGSVYAQNIDTRKAKIVTAQIEDLIVGGNVQIGSAEDAAGVTTIIGNTVTTGFVDALGVTAGYVAAENITGTYITGKTIRTAASGARIEINSSTLTTYNSSNQKHGPYIYPTDGDMIFHYNGIPVLDVGLAGGGKVSIQALSEYELEIIGYPNYDWVIEHTARSSDSSFGVFGVEPVSQQTAALMPTDGTSTIHDIEVKINGILNKLAAYGLFDVS